MKTGALIRKDGKCEFNVWAPFIKQLELKLLSPDRIIPMEKHSGEYFSVTLDDIKPGTKYFYILDKKKERPDPASNYQPDDVHGPSQVADHRKFSWGDENWKCFSLQQMIIYELHIGTFTTEGTFEAAIPRLKELKSLGINTIEIMPVCQFPGKRNWGYDGAYPYAVQNSYGGPEGFKNLVNECHKTGLAVVLDVVYNHLGPEGNYLGDFGPYFTKKYSTPWGSAVNFDDAYSEGVRNYFIQNALFWFENYHIDALRLDAIHGIYDFGAKHILEELSDNTEKLSREKGETHYLIAESDLNDVRIIKSREFGGYDMNAQWSDDFHHSIHALLTGDKSGYYEDFGKIEHLEKAYKEGFVYSWNHSNYRKKKHGNSSITITPNKFVVFSQNHDQIGNRAFSERLIKLTGFESVKLAAAACLLSPYIPLIFMGEEYAEDNPFYYFISHYDRNLVEAVRKGRKEEFSAFKWDREPPDPFAEDTFNKSKIDWGKRNGKDHKIMLEFYAYLINLRKEIPSFSSSDKRNLQIKSYEEIKVLILKRAIDNSNTVSIMNFNGKDTQIEYSFNKSKWNKIFDSSDTKWSGPGCLTPDMIEISNTITLRPHSFVAYIEEK